MVGAIVGVGALGAYSSYSATRASNEANERAKENARRRYRLDSSVANAQMEEQNQIAMSKMTDISKAFLKAKGTATAIQAESGVSGNVQKRIQFTDRAKSSELKGKVAKEVDTNVINISQGMLAKKIDTEAMIAEASANKKSVLLNTLTGAIGGGVQGYQLASAVKGIGNSGSGSPSSAGSEG